MGDTMKELLKLKRIYLLILSPLSLLLILLARKSNFFAEQIYALRIYKFLSQLVSLITGIIPISLAEIIIILLPAVIIALICRFIYRICKDRKNWMVHLVKAAINVLATGSVLLFTFTMFGGLNYYRYPFSYYSNLEIKDSSLEELYRLTKELAIQANELRSRVLTEDENGVFKLAMSKYELAETANMAIKQLSDEYPVLIGNYGQPKPILLSALMSYTETTGIFIPFTMEANVNVDIPDYTIPFTMLHELAHQRGFMREDEANFIAYLAGVRSDSIELKYSSIMHALVTAGNALYRQNSEMYKDIKSIYSDGVVKDLRANNEYWAKFEDTVVSTVSNKLNDTYLKANAQSDGVKSYGRMLDLLLALYRKEQNIN